MKIKVKLFATLKKYCDQNFSSDEIEIDIPEGSTIADLIEKIKLPKDIVKVAVINNQKVNFEDKLSNGDKIALFPLIAGG